MTIVQMSNQCGELARVELTDEDATTEAIARAAIDIIAQCMSLHPGDTIRVFERE